MKKNLQVFKMVYENENLVKQEKQGDYVPYDPVEGAWFFLKEKRGFVVSVFEFASILTEAEIMKFNRIFFSGCVESKTNLLIAKGSRRSNKALDRAEIAELMGFTGKTAVTKCTTLLNKFKELDILASKEEKFKGKRIEKWYVNPLLCKTHYRINVDLYEMFQESLDIFMDGQKVLLNALREALAEKHNPQVTSMDPRLAKADILKAQKEEEKEKFELIEEEELAIFNSQKNAEAGVSDKENKDTIRLVKTWAKHVDGVYVGPEFGMKKSLIEEVANAYLDYLEADRLIDDKEAFLLKAGHLISLDKPGTEIKKEVQA